MTKPPRLPDLDATWQRQTVLALDGGPISVVALEDLVATKKTQRDKDWATIGMLVEADMVTHHAAANEAHVAFWLREARDADTIIELASAFPHATQAAEPVDVGGHRCVRGASTTACGITAAPELTLDYSARTFVGVDGDEAEGRGGGA